MTLLTCSLVTQLLLRHRRWALVAKRAAGVNGSAPCIDNVVNPGVKSGANVECTFAASNTRSACHGEHGLRRCRNMAGPALATRRSLATGDGLLRSYRSPLRVRPGNPRVGGEDHCNSTRGRVAVYERPLARSAPARTLRRRAQPPAPLLGL